MPNELSTGSHHYEMDADIHVHQKSNREHVIARSRPDLATAQSIARTNRNTQQGIEHACRTLNQASEACPKAIAGISQACQDCVMRFLADRSQT